MSATRGRFETSILTRYLLDTNVVSSLAPSKGERPASHAGISAWIVANTDRLFLSAVTALEIEAGVIKLARSAPGRWQQQMSEWFSAILLHYADRILPLDLQIARLASAMTDRNKAQGLYPGMADTIIAATALAHGQVLLTRNLKHFEGFEVQMANPFERLPP